MESQQIEPSPSTPDAAADTQHSAPTRQDASIRETPSILSASGISSWARSLKIPQPSGHEDLQPGNAENSTFSRITSGLGFRLSPKSSREGGESADENSTVAQPQPSGHEDLQPGNAEKSTFSRITSGLGFRSSPKSSGEGGESADENSTVAQTGVMGSLAKGLMNSSKSAVKAVQVRARHIVSQNKRRYQEGGFDLDLTYITENIIAMGFPAGDMSSGLFGYVEGFYRNHMEEVIRFFESQHKGKYKVYNLCSERLYDASLFEGKVASFPFDDHNCPPIQLVTSFCQSAYSWLKDDIENVIVVHCKAGMARTGLMISSLLLYLKFFPTAEESIDYYNQKRCIDGKGLVLPSQIRYVKYFERILTYFNGENQPGRRCMLRGFRLHRCPYWIRPSITISNHNGDLFSTKKHPRTKDLMPEDFWFNTPKKGIMVFALPGELGLTELAGDFKIQFHDRQGDFYCWLNTTMMENRKTLSTSDLDGFDKRKLPSPGFQVEVVLADYNGSAPPKPTDEVANKEHASASASASTAESNIETRNPDKSSGSQDKDDVFSDSEAEDGAPPKPRRANTANSVEGPTGGAKGFEAKALQEETASIVHGVKQVSLKGEGPPTTPGGTELRNDRGLKSSSAVPETSEPGSRVSEFKAIAADASVFSFGDEDEYDSE